jgi:riboflavin synthase
MFTGIIEELGTLKGIKRGADSAVLEVQAKTVLSEVKAGDSIAVNGVCLTVTGFSPSYFTAEVMAETLRRSTLGTLRPGDRVNLERALRLSDRLGGHMVSGHIDGVGMVKSVAKEDIAVVFTITAPEPVARYIIEKGSIAIDGISLTVVDFKGLDFRVSIIPHTASLTTLGFRKPGDQVNLEADVIAKYVERLAGKAGSQGGGIDMKFLAENGFV